MKQLLLISLLLVLVCCKKEDAPESVKKNVTNTTQCDSCGGFWKVTYTTECDSCRVFMWKYVGGKTIVVDTIVQDTFNYSFFSDVPRTLAVSIKYENYSKDTFPVTAIIKVNGLEVARETDEALNYGQSDGGKDWVHTSYVLE